ncbi:serine/threonine-protein phosphatase [Streptomyces mobaraensis NBRC 13819 = DSM 40847]|uniref:Magnesium or manganese-dependent protein phosphatase n=1 Tax=Streptomyces mobaraensis (strain ATCC 29032 / DSM 40847 / JCM 4168 / NBRC 13819 / NCIMB 11159 / IPCR 16-22) TaxID=1223523 RepID=M3C823_STRM1|nr:PP2C family protein-serine/threonine phosphatase [Streptomyces mobaraensis]EMF00121.1 magnesium or manganese-dependent protein phosphatase [Streptomyces mobaraensis NBRC 13819 = DSM 40847]QTT72985.1 serine/threonine-protein phosphatase [Streptomyces mobaraensis NBRC 13819 = DSM 40847]
MIRTKAAARCRRGAVLALPGLWVAGVVVWELLSPLGVHFVQLLAAAPAIACAGSGRRQCVLLGGGCALFALVPLGSAGRADPAMRLGTCCAVLAVVAAAWLTSHRRLRLTRELERLREIAATAQHAVLRPLPPRLDGLTLAGGHRSASEGALLGGDLYEALATRHGVRLVIGDVRGHGLPALGTVAALLGSFREAAHDEDGLPGVLRRMERAFHRHLGDRASGQSPPSGEDFATVLVLQVGPENEVTALNCGHPWPHRLTGGDHRPPAGVRAEVLSAGEPLPPLGMFPLPAEPPVRRLTRLLPGETLVLHTDGVEDARDAAGRFFPLTRALAEAAASAPVVPAAVVDRVRAAVLRHTGGVLTDDFALLALRNDRAPDRTPRGPLVGSCPHG